MDEKYIDRSVNVFFNVFDDIGSNSRGGEVSLQNLFLNVFNDIGSDGREQR